MRAIAQNSRALPPRSKLNALLLFLAISQAARGQEKDSNHAASLPAIPAPVVGADVVVKGPSISLDDEGRQVASSPRTRYRLDREEGNRVHLVADDNSRRGWVGRDQVVPFVHAIEFFTREITEHPQDSDNYWMRARLWTVPTDDERRWPTTIRSSGSRPNTVRPMPPGEKFW